MAEAGDRLGFDPEPLAMLGVGLLAVKDHLQGDRPAQRGAGPCIRHPCRRGPARPGARTGRGRSRREYPARRPNPLVRGAWIELLLGGHKLRLPAWGGAEFVGDVQSLLLVVKKMRTQSRAKTQRVS